LAHAEIYNCGSIDIKENAFAKRMKVYVIYKASYATSNYSVTSTLVCDMKLLSKHNKRVS